MAKPRLCLDRKRRKPSGNFQLIYGLIFESCSMAPEDIFPANPRGNALAISIRLLLAVLAGKNRG